MNTAEGLIVVELSLSDWLHATRRSKPSARRSGRGAPWRVRRPPASAASSAAHA
jgi:hypothetical protein